MVLETLLLAAVLSSPPDVEALRRELDAVAARIEQLKARAQGGESVEGELQPLLVRSQELADELERALPVPPARPSPPTLADQARERADELRSDAAALRAQAERLEVTLAGLEARIAAALRAAAAAPAPAEDGFPHATLARTASREDDRQAWSRDDAALGRWVGERARLATQIDALRGEATRLEAEASALDRE